MSGGRLFVVATPIGNLGDVTFRAIETLRSVPLVAAEDTRLTRRLFARYDVRAPLVSFHARSSAERAAELLAHLREGGDLALVSDAGTPAISDPGEALVAAWAAEGGAVVPIPGPSSVVAAVSATGVAGPRWSFEGFLPRAGRERRERLARIAADERGSVLFEAPNRVAATLADLAAACGEGRPGAVCRELTKLHEEIRRGTLGELAAEAREGGIAARGEFVLVVGWTDRPAASAVTPRGARGVARTEDALSAARDDVERRVAAGERRAAAVRAVASETGLPRRQLYGAPREDDAR